MIDEDARLELSNLAVRNGLGNNGGVGKIDLEKRGEDRTRAGGKGLGETENRRRL